MVKKDARRWIGMPDREKVIKAIEICYTVGHNCTECPLFYEDECNDRLMRDALALLKEHKLRLVLCRWGRTVKWDE